MRLDRAALLSMAAIQHGLSDESIDDAIAEHDRSAPPRSEPVIAHPDPTQPGRTLFYTRGDPAVAARLQAERQERKAAAWAQRQPKGKS